MHPVLQKTFGGLSKQYYFRQFVFGLVLAALIVVLLVSMAESTGKAPPFFTFLLIAINTILYPYSRFVYESIVNFIIGNNVFIVNAIAMIVVKIMMMSICWSMAIFIAPVGLAYLYYHHSKNEKRE
ncbi:MAG: hypothetical protein LBF61_06915 [Azoarcus sp.]|jgi:hypothetical protein|nr:hypothetical protein [Azoarcus sp.]